VTSGSSVTVVRVVVGFVVGVSVVIPVVVLPPQATNKTATKLIKINVNILLFNTVNTPFLLKKSALMIFMKDYWHNPSWFVFLDKKKKAHYKWCAFFKMII